MDEKLKTLWESAKTEASNLWSKNKILFFLIIPLIILAIFRDVLIQLLVSSSKKILTETKAKDEDLKGQANSLNSQANQLIDDANKKSENKPTVDEDWYKK